MNKSALTQKLNALARFPSLDKTAIQRFGDSIEGLDDWSLFRINPLRFATQYGFDQNTVIDLFLHSVKVGLFDFSYTMVCPACGAIEYTHTALDQIERYTFHCTVCNEDVPSNLDDQVQVGFSISPAIHRLNIDPYSDLKVYYRYFFSADLHASPQLREYSRDMFRGFAVIEPDENGRLTFTVEPNTQCRALHMETHTALYLDVSSETAPHPQIVEVDLLMNGLLPDQLSVSAGELTLVVHNRTKTKQGITASKVDFDRVVRVLTENPNIRHPFLTGKMLLNNQTFRDLFRIQALAPDLRLNIRSLTVLFTDLKNSTEMYAKVGDMSAYQLVQEHFALLTQVARQHAGSVVKTMGDAIMATFSEPQDGILAAIEMIAEINRLNERHGVEFGIKIGLNEGAVLAVNADERLDYFGQNVNVAARVQGLAQAGEIWITDSIYRGIGVQSVLENCGCSAVEQWAYLKGVQEPTTVYRCGL